MKYIPIYTSSTPGTGQRVRNVSKAVFPIALFTGLIFLLSSIFVLQTTSTVHAAGSAYYVDCSASSNGNGSQASPWNTLSSVNNHAAFNPGDQILLKRNMTCAGMLTPAGSGSSAGGFIMIDAYGSGTLPIIDAGTSNEAAIKTYNQQYWQVQNIETTGGASFGICLCGGGGIALTSLHAINVIVHDTHGSNVSFSALQIGEAANQSSAPIVTDALVDGALVYNVSSAEKGILLIIGTDVGNGDLNKLGTGTIQNSTVHDIGWDGVGALYAKNAVIQRNTIYNTGINSQGGGNGIFTWACNGCIIQNNEVYNAHSPYGTDGGGIDIDGYGTTNNIAQYNYAHDNDGPCLLVYSAAGQTTKNSTFRYNVCSNNGRDSTLSTYGDVFISNCTCGSTGGYLDGVQFYNNTFYWNPSIVHSLVHTGTALWASPQTQSDFFKNNLIYGSSTGTDFVYTPPGSPLVLDYNMYWTTSTNPPRWFVQNNCNPCTSFTIYQSQTGQDAHGKYGNPNINNPTYASVGRPNSAFTLQPGSPALSAGTNIGSMGTQDFFGNVLGSSHNIGAYESAGVSGSTFSAPIGYWKLNDGSGSTAADASGNTNNGTISGASWVSGKIGGALSFNGSNGSVNMGTASILGLGTTSFSLATWFKSSTTGWQRLISKGDYGDTNGYLLGDANGSLVFGIGANGSSANATVVSTSSSFNDGTWHQLTAVVDRSAQTIQLYVDGVAQTLTLKSGYCGSVSGTLVSIAGCGSLNASSNDPFTLASYNGTTEFFNGTIDDVRLYNGALSVTDIQNLVNLAPAGYWKLDDGSGTSAVDESGNGNTGSIAGASWVTGKFGGALSFNGSDNSVSMGNPTTLNLNTGSMSLAIWFKSSSTGWQRLISKGDYGDTNGYLLGDASGSLAFGIGANGSSVNATVVSTTSSFNDGTWHQLTTVVDRSAQTIQLYVDGVAQTLTLKSGYCGSVSGTLVSIAGCGSLNASSNDPFTLASYNGTAEFFNGTIDDVRVYHKALSSQEIQDILSGA